MRSTLAPTTLYFQQFYLECLSHASYLIGDTSTGNAVVVDPQRDISEYLAEAEAHEKRGAVLRAELAKVLDEVSDEVQR